MESDSKIYIAGHRGMVGSAIERNLRAKGYDNIVSKTSRELDLTNQSAVKEFFKEELPDYVFFAAARVGGIQANIRFGGEFIYENLMIETNVIHQAYLSKVKKLLFLGSSCIYPKMAEQPIKEDYLLTGMLESSNEPYAVAKIAGLKMCEAYRKQYGCNFISAMPTNLYGPNDNYDSENSHVLPALIKKFCEAKKNEDESVCIWGSGSPFREFMHVDDMADACVFLMERYDGYEFINVGTGKDISIKDLAFIISQLTEFDGEIVFDNTKPDGTPKKLLDISRLKKMGWNPSINLIDGIRSTIENYRKAFLLDKVPTHSLS